MLCQFVAGLVPILWLVPMWQGPPAGEKEPAVSRSALRIEAAEPAEVASGWRRVHPGIEHLALERATPPRLSGQALRIDLRHPGVEFFVTPSNGDRPLEADSVTTSAFLTRHDLHAAINAAPFHPVVNDEGVPQDVLGLAVSEGQIVSGPTEHYGTLLIDGSNRARIVPQTRKMDLTSVRHAVGGFGIVLKGGKVSADAERREPRSAVGISADGRYLILLVIDGRQPWHSAGATLAETADWLKRLGAEEGLNLDGGGSSSLVVRGADGSARILNRPIHGGQPGRERPCPNHLGVRIRSGPKPP